MLQSLWFYGAAVRKMLLPHYTSFLNLPVPDPVQGPENYLYSIVSSLDWWRFDGREHSRMGHRTQNQNVHGCQGAQRKV